MKKLLSEVLVSIEEHFDYKKIETTREHKQTLYHDIEYIDTSSTRRYISVTPNQVHSFFEIGLYLFREEQDAEKYIQHKKEDQTIQIKEQLTPIISLWFYIKQDENGKHETVVFDTLISPNQRMQTDIRELSAFIEDSFLSYEEKQTQLSTVRGNL